MESKIDTCPIHGLTKFHYYKKHGRVKGQWKCSKCEVEYSVLKRQMYKLRAVLCKGGACSICGYNKNIAALEFHHLNPALKDFTISSTYRNWKDVKKELDKCIIVCSNCHRELHNLQSYLGNLLNLIEQHKFKIRIKLLKYSKKYKFTLDEVNLKYEELKSWQLVANFYKISLATLKRHRNQLKLL